MDSKNIQIHIFLLSIIFVLTEEREKIRMKEVKKLDY